MTTLENSTEAVGDIRPDAPNISEMEPIVGRLDSFLQTLLHLEDVKCFEAQSARIDVVHACRNQVEQLKTIFDSELEAHCERVRAASPELVSLLEARRG